MRALWNGSISFGLINIPVKLYSGTNPREGLDLNLLHKLDHSPIRYSRVCRKDGREVPWDEIVKGYKYEDGDYIVLSQKELDSLDAKKTHSIDIHQFIEAADVDPRFFEKPYYLEPLKGGEKAYALLRQALQQSGKLALAKFVLSQREHAAVIMPHGRALVLEQMRFPTDLREVGELNLPGDREVTKSEIEMSLKLVRQETKPFIPEDLRDTYTEELEEIIAKKAQGKKITKTKAQAPTPTKDLMATLKASLNKR
ncbi:MAG TPA: Ku protein [Candidatus Polarisedimenticolaceae bacterium]|nr:Ku protein [Candidatus Polarisedimenticolaceae bacterium]